MDYCPNCGFDLENAHNNSLSTSQGNFYICEEDETTEAMLHAYGYSDSGTVFGHDTLEDALEEARESGAKSFKIYNDRLELVYAQITSGADV